MVWHILMWYAIVCYIIGSVLFVFDVGSMLFFRSKAIKAQRHTKMDLSRYINISPAILIGIFALLLAPLTAWHQVLHYAAIVWYKSQGKPVKYWV